MLDENPAGEPCETCRALHNEERTYAISGK